jgi:hypothetical protein
MTAAPWVLAAVGALASFVLARLARRASVADRARVLAPGRIDRMPAWLADPLQDALDAAGLPCTPIAAVQFWARCAAARVPAPRTR